MILLARISLSAFSILLCAANTGEYLMNFGFSMYVLREVILFPFDIRELGEYAKTCIRWKGLIMRI